ncbi:STAS domain-containing protein [Streptomyces sp. NPDC056656]|uniref:STAS domain-containing protein n=1 Tax=Streptomyces sp. NPDC056656 TaxID=3345895 RepID=UPI0036C2FCFE
MSGEIDLDTAPALDAEICAYPRCRPAAVTVDLSAVIFIDCSVLNALLRSHARAVRAHSTVRIGPVSATVAHFLELVCDLHPLPGDLVQDHIASSASLPLIPLASAHPTPAVPRATVVLVPGALADASS